MMTAGIVSAGIPELTETGGNDSQFAVKVKNFTTAHPGAGFTGPLSFLNTYRYDLSSSLLTGIGAVTEFNAGVTFWNRYGRILYNATVGQLAYNATYANGTARPKPVLRTTSQSRIWNSEINWALGFFGPSFQATPDPTLTNWTSSYEVVIIPEGGTENNTLASYDSCFNDNNDVPGYDGDDDLFAYIPKYLGNATARLQKYAPAGFTFNTNDTYAMQSICAYEMAYIGQSDFCMGFSRVTELLARLENQYITSSNSSVNSTLDNNPTTFPLGRPFYTDFSHDDIIISVLTAMSLEYFHSPPSLSQYPPDPKRPFVLSKMTPFGGRLITEVIGCNSANPLPLNTAAPNRTQYYPTEYGYNASAATHKFVRLRLNNGILPLATLRGGAVSARIY
ncbi:hypothetical protein MRB53_039248 [Persea americana]|nr:hypothetical protein MRB53_039248 [Persea americana]